MTTPLIQTPASYIPAYAVSFGAVGAAATAVTPESPLPVEYRAGAADTAPLTGSASAATIVGPFAPQLLRDIVLTLSGNWAGAVTLFRSTDGGTTRFPATVGGNALTFAGNVNEVVWVESEAAAQLYLSLNPSSGTVSYRVAQ